MRESSTSKHRLCVEQRLTTNTDLTLDDAASHYLARVLRLREGRQVELFNGDGHNYQCTITHSDKKTVSVHINTQTPGPLARPYLHLAIALLKGDKLDFALQKATELDVASVWLTQTSRCELKLSEKRLANRLSHWQRIMVSACEQSGRTRIPALHAPQPLGAVLQATADYRCYCLEPSASSGQLLVEQQDVCLFTGPEGGFDSAELALLARQGCNRIAVGELILRAETAPLVGLALAGAARRLTSA